MILSGAFSSEVLPYARVFTAFAATGVVLAAIYMLHAVLKMFWGPLDKPENRGLADLTRREVFALAPLVVLIFWIGLYPSAFLSRMEPTVNAFIEGYVEKRNATVDIEEARLAPGPAPHGAIAARPEVRVIAPGGAQ